MEVCDIRFKHPATHMVVGATGTGKSHYVANILKRRNVLFNPEPTTIIMFYSQWQESYAVLKDGGYVDHFAEGLPNQDTFNNLITNAKSSLVIFDDLFGEFEKSNFDLDKLITVQSHHLNCSTLLILHRAFGKTVRNLSLNTHYFHQLYSPRDSGQLAELSRQAFGKGSSNFLPACLQNQASKKQHAHLLVNFAPSLSNPILKVIGNLFYENNTPITVYAQNKCNTKMTADPYRCLYLVDVGAYNILTAKQQPNGSNKISTNNSTVLNLDGGLQHKHTDQPESKEEINPALESENKNYSQQNFVNDTDNKIVRDKVLLPDNSKSENPSSGSIVDDKREDNNFVIPTFKKLFKKKNPVKRLLPKKRKIMETTEISPVGKPDQESQTSDPTKEVGNFSQHHPTESTNEVNNRPLQKPPASTSSHKLKARIVNAKKILNNAISPKKNRGDFSFKWERIANKRKSQEAELPDVKSLKKASDIKKQFVRLRKPKQTSLPVGYKTQGNKRRKISDEEVTE